MLRSSFVTALLAAPTNHLHPVQRPLPFPSTSFPLPSLAPTQTHAPTRLPRPTGGHTYMHPCKMHVHACALLRTQCQSWGNRSAVELYITRPLKYRLSPKETEVLLVL